MAFVKLDCGMLDSTTWFDKDARDIFITALLMATPKEYDNEQSQIEVSSLDDTGWIVPAGWYGFVDAASLGIINRCGLPTDDGLAALERLGNPESESRSQKNGGRRMARIDGGFLILNYDDYREKDHTAAERQRRYRAKKKAESNAVTSRNKASQPRNVTQAEAEAEAYTNNKKGHQVTEFDRFWSVYPKKVKKKTALDIWKRKKPDADALIADIQNRLANDAQWLGGFIPHPTTYLNGERWNDELEPMNEARKRTNEFEDVQARNRKAAGLD